MEELFKNLAENFKQLAEQMPTKLKEVEKSMTPKEAELIQKAMKESGYEKAMKDLDKTQIKFNQFMKRYAS